MAWSRYVNVQDQFASKSATSVLETSHPLNQPACKVETTSATWSNWDKSTFPCKLCSNLEERSRPVEQPGLGYKPGTPNTAIFCPAEDRFAHNLRQVEPNTMAHSRCGVLKQISIVFAIFLDLIFPYSIPFGCHQNYRKEAGPHRISKSCTTFWDCWHPFRTPL